MFKFLLSLLVCASFSILHASAFIPEELFEEGEIVEIAVEETVEEDSSANEDAKPEDEAKKKEEEAKKIINAFVNACNRQRFMRNSNAIVSELAKRMKKPEAAEIPENESDNDRIQRLGRERADGLFNAVMCGDWPFVKQELSSLDKSQQERVYNRILNGLQRGESILLPADVLGLAEAWPQDFEQDTLANIGGILNKSVEHVGNTGSLVQVLQKGSERFGGIEASARSRAVSLLLAANQIKIAGLFLPPLSEAEASDDPKMLDVHARYLSAIGQEKDKQALQQGWELTLKVLAHKDSDDETVNSAIYRGLNLLLLVPEEDAQNWLHTSFADQPANGMQILAGLSQQMASAFSAKEIPPRVSALQLQHRIITSLLQNFSIKPEEWQTPINILVMSWIKEAELCLNSDKNSNNNNQYNDYYYRQQRNRRAQPLDAKELLRYGPSSLWYPQLDSSLAQRVQSLNGALMCKAGDIDGTMEVIQALAKHDMDEAQALAKNVLEVWAQIHRPERSYRSHYMSFNAGGYYNPYNRYRQQAQGIPLTRSKQNKYLKELAVLMQKLQALHLPQIDPSSIVAAFDACHSPAEVYHLKDLKTVFGSFDTLDKFTMLQIVANMRQNLAQRWRQPKVQQEQKTKRNNKELIAEVKRGYKLANHIIDEVQTRDQYYWQAQLLQAQVVFDAAEFIYGQEENLQVYTQQRDKSLGLFERAVEVYLKHHSKDTRTIEPYMSWFNALLGASDLSYLTRQHDPEEAQLLGLRQHILNLSDEQREWHLNEFGVGLGNAIQSVPGELKPRFLKAGLVVLQDHKSGKKAKDLLDFYNDLLSEIELHVAVDGSTNVGEDIFGLHIGLRHTDALSRESGGFAKFLSNQVHISYNKAPVDYRDDFEKHIRESLSDRFDVIAMSFHEPSVQSIGCGRERWQETPMAYAVIKAKDASVDRIPSLHLDMDFMDGHGSVILPVDSGEQLIDASKAGERPVRELSFEMVFDDRRANEGQIQLEIHAKGKGIIPELDELVEALPSHWQEVDRYADDIQLERLEIDDVGSAAIAQRLWRLTYNATGTITAFNFPKTKIEAKVTRKRYQDADIVDAEESLALFIEAPQADNWYWYLLLIIPVIAITIWRRGQDCDINPAQRYQLPQDINVFSCCALLRQIASDKTLALNDAQRAEIQNDINNLETQHFSREAEELQTQQLKDRVEAWLKQL